MNSTVLNTPPVVRRARRRRWPLVMLALLGLAALLLWALGSLTASLVAGLGDALPVDVIVDGEHLGGDWRHWPHSGWHGLMTALGVGLGLLLALVVVATVLPMALLTVLGVVGAVLLGGVLLVVGLPLGLVLLGLALLLSPLLLLGALLWWLIS